MPPPGSHKKDYTSTIDVDQPIDPNEPTYCVCHQVSFGDMIACDNENVLWTDELNAYLSKYHLELDPLLVALVGRHSRKPWTKFINAENQHLAVPEVEPLEVPEAIDFLDKLLQYDQQERPTAKQAMVNQVAELRQQIELKEVAHEELRTRISNANQTGISLNQPVASKGVEFEREILEAEYSFITDKIRRMQDKDLAKKTEMQNWAYVQTKKRLQALHALDMDFVGFWRRVS